MADYKFCKILEKKRDGQALTKDDMDYFVKAVAKLAKSNEGGCPDRSQIGAMLMAIYLKGLNDVETNLLTLKMRDSGRIFEWPKEVKHRIVDKHSTGGVGDKISLILVPALAACNVLVPMISGRSLGHTGGTLDKLEAIEGLSVNQSDNEILQAIQTVGCCIVGQTDECVPADKILYECRDLTSTVDYPPLIIASIVSKKLSENPAALIYDVKFGKGSFFKSLEDALETAKGLVAASQPVNAVALLTSMEAPIGRSVGDSLEILEAIECLKGNGPSDVIQLVEALGNELLNLVDCKKSTRITETLKNGKALAKFHDMLIHQHATSETARDLCYGEAKKSLRKANKVHVSVLTYIGIDGYISSIDPMVLGSMWKEEYGSSHNPHVGFVIVKSIGDSIHSGEVWLKFHHEREVITEDQRNVLSHAIQVSKLKVERKLIEKRVFIKDGSVVVEDY